MRRSVRDEGRKAQRAPYGQRGRVHRSSEGVLGWIKNSVVDWLFSERSEAVEAVPEAEVEKETTEEERIYSRLSVLFSEKGSGALTRDEYREVEFLVGKCTKKDGAAAEEIRSKPLFIGPAVGKIARFGGEYSEQLNKKEMDKWRERKQPVTRKRKNNVFCGYFSPSEEEEVLVLPEEVKEPKREKKGTRVTEKILGELRREEEMKHPVQQEKKEDKSLFLGGQTETRPGFTLGAAQAQGKTGVSPGFPFSLPKKTEGGLFPVIKTEEKKETSFQLQPVTFPGIKKEALAEPNMQPPVEPKNETLFQFPRTSSAETGESQLKQGKPFQIQQVFEPKKEFSFAQQDTLSFGQKKDELSEPRKETPSQFSFLADSKQKEPFEKKEEKTPLSFSLPTNTSFGFAMPTDTTGSTGIASQIKPLEQKNPFEQKNPLEGSNPFEQKNPLGGSNPFEQKNPLGGSNPFEQKNPLEGGNPFEKKNPFEQKNPFGGSNPFEKKNPLEGGNPFEKKNPFEQKNPLGGSNLFEQKNPFEQKNSLEESNPFEGSSQLKDVGQLDAPQFGNFPSGGFTLGTTQRKGSGTTRRRK
ncbi:MAG: uncharacterized protein A8A55_0347 [Amphiamblys sp. WSBS2006]|nr:MAG: uncharacterized protein A8A55_0347 [Amphiamblys sp. WSBS2006]